MGYRLCIMAHFDNTLISRLFRVFWTVLFAQKNYKQFLECILTCFLEF